MKNQLNAININTFLHNMIRCNLFFLISHEKCNHIHVIHPSKRGITFIDLHLHVHVTI